MRPENHCCCVIRSNRCVEVSVVAKIVFYLRFVCYTSVSIRIMRSLLFVIALLFASVLCQEYTMGTKAQPKADLPVDDKLIIQNIVSHCA